MSSSREALAELLWAEKYRPRTLDEIVDQEEIVARLKKFVEEKNMPHLLFAGPPGTGKTTSAHCLAHDLYGPNYMQYMLELNASVAKDTPILVRIGGKPIRTTFMELDKIYFNGDNVIRYGDSEYVETPGLEVLTVNKETGKVEWKHAKWLIRHRVRYVARVKFRGGGELKLTGNHSVITLSDNGELVEKKVSELKPGDYLLSFVAELPGREKIIDLARYMISRKRVKADAKLCIGEKLAWLLGVYVAEGALGFSRTARGVKTGGQIVITVAYPGEEHLANRVTAIASEHNIPVYTNLVGSGFDRNRFSAKQVRLLYTGLARYLSGNAYSGVTRARFKRVPPIVYSIKRSSRESFLKGLYEGDGTGRWGSVVRITSASKDLLIDIAWLARITGIESSIFNREVRLIWKAGMKYRKADLLPSKPFIKFFEKISRAIGVNWRYILRHQLYKYKEAVSRQKLREIMDSIDTSKLTAEELKIYRRLKTIVNSGLHIVKITDIEVIEYNDYVYDISVPGNNMFFAGEIPILLHNSDERGIDVIRSKVKEFARTRVPGEIPFKIVLLDEADNMTADAQQALRRLMELFTANTRFILIANYPSKIIEPIQSRCAVFRFSPLKKEDVVARLKWIADQEGVEYDEDALETIYEISEGDMRRAINVLQAASAIGRVTVEAVYKVVGLAHPREVREMLKLALAGNFTEAREKLRTLMINYGLSGLDIIKQIHREIFSGEIKLPEEYKILVADYAGEIQFRLVQGSDDEIQLNAFLARLAFIGKKFKV